ncbi:Hypothetical_protein [Hexamita inflata]|uniref:Hypothetical_protein n=1 Tax=Hexamita inflata TaxID=28002 RepID=A0AA86UDE0_9EUKA|nr:Hypothetical protein HINF_LOCUS34397 [Hexamita inflata]
MYINKIHVAYLNGYKIAYIHQGFPMYVNELYPLSLNQQRPYYILVYLNLLQSKTSQSLTSTLCMDSQIEQSTNDEQTIDFQSLLVSKIQFSLICQPLCSICDSLVIHMFTQFLFFSRIIPYLVNDQKHYIKDCSMITIDLDDLQESIRLEYF